VFLKLPPPLEGKKRGKGVSIEVIRMVVIGFVLIAGKIVTRSVTEKDVLLESRQEGGKLPIVLIVQALKLRNDILEPDIGKKKLLEDENREKLAIFESYGAHFEHLIYDTPHYIEDSASLQNLDVCSSAADVSLFLIGDNISCFHCDISYDYSPGKYDRSRYACASKAMANLDASLKASVKGFLVIHADFFLLPTFLVTARKIMDENPNSFWLPYSNMDNKRRDSDSFGLQAFKTTSFDLITTPTALSQLSFPEFDRARNAAIIMVPGISGDLSPIWEGERQSANVWVDMYFVSICI